MMSLTRTYGIMRRVSVSAPRTSSSWPRFAFAAGALSIATGFCCTKVAECEKSEKMKPSIAGEWKLDHARSESLAPFLSVLGVPSVFAFFLDRLGTILRIEILDDQSGSALRDFSPRDLTSNNRPLVLKAENQTWYFGKDLKTLSLDGKEVVMTAKGGRKKYKGSSTIEFEADGCTPRAVTVHCRLFQRGDGWKTEQRWSLEKEDMVNKGEVVQSEAERAASFYLKEEMTVYSPEQNVTIVRRFISDNNGNSLGTKLSDQKDSRSSNSKGPVGAVVLMVVAAGLSTWAFHKFGPKKKD